MIVFDTDTLTHFFLNHPKIVQRHQEADAEIVITIISRIEVLRGRFDTLTKAANGAGLQTGYDRLVQAERDLAAFRILPVDSETANTFDRLLKDKKAKKIGRGDLLIASISLANKATLVTRNLKDFRLVPGLILENWAD
jgi:tRNA(fMet)-specific endonuclease VapC